MNPSLSMTDRAFEQFSATLDRSGLRAALADLLEMTDFRFIAIFRFRGDKANAAVSCDREQPDVTAAVEVPAKATYCCFARDSGGAFTTGDALQDRSPFQPPGARGGAVLLRGSGHDGGGRAARLAVPLRRRAARSGRDRLRIDPQDREHAGVPRARAALSCVGHLRLAGRQGEALLLRLRRSMELVFVSGFATSGTLIVAIGAQNAFVLRCGLRQEHVLAVVPVCALPDGLLITPGVVGLRVLVQQSPGLLAIARYGGALFLIGCGALAARRALAGSGGVQTDAAGTSQTLGAAISTCLAFTHLNPHCWLDTVVLLRSISAQRPADERAWFGSGAVAASFVWFFALDFGARLLRPLFEWPLAWRVLDAVIAAVMWSLAVALLLARGPDLQVPWRAFSHVRGVTRRC